MQNCEVCGLSQMTETLFRVRVREKHVAVELLKIKFNAFRTINKIPFIAVVLVWQQFYRGTSLNHST